MEAADHRVEDEEKMDPALVEKGRTEEMDFMFEKMFELGSWQEATKTRTKPTKTNQVGRVKKGEAGHDLDSQFLT